VGSTITVRHADATVELEAGATAIQALKALEAVKGQIVAARVDGRPWDLDREVPDGAEVEGIAADSDDGRFILRHSAAHVMAQAVTDLFPGAKWAIGPPIEDGFYYDFDVERPFTPEDLERIEARMAELLAEKQRFVREEVARDDALVEFADQPYKVQIIELVDDGTIVSSVDVGEGDGEPAEAQGEPTFTVYRNVRPDGEVAWSDLCRGPHVPSTDRIPAFKLLRSAGAYWRGREDQPMLQRIYGTAWESRKALQQHLTLLEEAKKRDHRKLGRELELIHQPDELGPGLSIFLPHGAIVRKQMEDWIRDETLARGYQPVYTPHIAKEDLWRISGHLENYAELMYPGMELEDSSSAYRLKPMNCPFHILAFTSRTRSYRDLPLRIAELGTVYRYERSGVVNGMLRARGFTQDDSHIFCTADQVVDEVVGCIAFARDLYAAFGLGEPSRVAVSTRPDGKSIGTEEQWEYAEKALMEAAAASGFDHVIDEGEGAFYGPKIDIHARDAIGREWQLTTIQVDFNLPERFDISYVGEDGAKHRPFMVHRALFGSIERFFAVMVESFNGAFPTWLAPVQAVVVPVAGEFVGYADEVASALRGRGVRVAVDDSDAGLGKKIREAQTSKVPYTLVVGESEREARTVAVRPYRGDQRKDVPLDGFVEELTVEIAARAPAR
jgi:threonyl-tRNA synthetase